MASKAVVRALQALERDGRLSPKDVLEDAKNESSPLHNYFEWDDGIAAEKYRLEQAAQLIRKVKIEVTYHDVPIKTPQYVRDAAPAAEAGYVNIASIRSESDQAREVIIEEMKRVVNAANRAKAVAAFLKAENDIAQISEIANSVLQRARDFSGDSQTDGVA